MGSAILGARNLTGCEHRLALDFAPAESTTSTTETAEANRRIEAAQSHRREVIARLYEANAQRGEGTVVLVEADGHRERVEATRAAMDAGVRWILQASLPTDVERGRRGHAEALVRVGEGYVPIIIVNHRVTNGTEPRNGEPPSLRTSPLSDWDPAPDATRSLRSQRRDVMRLAQLAAMLDDLGRLHAPRAEALGGLIGLDADCIVEVQLGGETVQEYDDTFERRRAIAEGRVETGPRKVSECRSCHWWPRCEAELTQTRDVSLVVGGNQGQVLRDAGIVTIDQLADYRGREPEEWVGAIPFSDTVVAAKCWVGGIPLVRRHDRPRVQRADIEVDVDMESFSERGAYMWGTLLTDNTDPGREVIYRPFVTWDPLPSRDEGRSFAEFWAWLMAERNAAHAAGKTFAAYCYSQHAENRWLRGSADRFGDMPGVPSRQTVDAFIASKEWIDIFEAVSDNFVCPRGKGLKRIAPVAGFGWRDDEAGGEASMEWYAAAVALDGADLDLTQRERLLDYNEDDVRATKVLREWIASDEVLTLPLAADLLAT
ncbi:TM0106 family RecB-like putative nuclease [Gordonia sp. (in: high G+C Gram-positive bacteria)]|uniref:TM0106 family RecB-like putative nuclease n=1 Tax=Gordonia sp. (in: high G+C Gram-positive bacteria) TaxID=84139 RepID=UPI0016A8B2D7|nr:TM0106 family RecB-like putative nuclease [Gordonia sp. (in: high G+C Gram-positive bacteria)]NLG47388.1 TM0106 family RecB-like putative nuclease [Gordonia sp. (in: high G+C Gram-positive bacteria)]